MQVHQGGYVSLLIHEARVGRPQKGASVDPEVAGQLLGHDYQGWSTRCYSPCALKGGHEKSGLFRDKKARESLFFIPRLKNVKLFFFAVDQFST